MKRYLISALVIGGLLIESEFNAFAQEVAPAQYNAVKREGIKKAGIKTSADYAGVAATDKASKVNYYDGLGRMLAEISVRAGGNQKDMVGIPAYDNLGRTDTVFLPYVATTTDGSFSKRSTMVGNQNSFYNNTSDKVADDTRPYGVSVYEVSAALYLKEKGAPGVNYQPGAHTVSRTTSLNGSSEVRMWKSDLTSPGYYAASQVVVEEVTDENGNKVKTFTNNAGLLLEKHVQEGSSNWLKTLYIYDDRGRIVTILQPEGVYTLGGSTSISSTISGPFGFFFTYDSYGRVVEKKVPGSAPDYYCYDPLGRLVLMQDGNLRLSNKWFYIKYDRNGRAVIQGIYTNTTYTTRSTVQSNLLDGLSYSTGDTYYEKMQNGGTHGYTNQSFPTSGTDVLSVMYYDTYDLDVSGSADYSYTSQSLTATTPQGSISEGTQFKTVGNVTATKVSILGTSNWLLSYIFYDNHGNVIQVKSNNHLSSTVDNVTTNLFDFTGKVWKTKKYINAGGSNTTTVYNRYDYDEAGRVTKIYQTNNSDSETLLAFYTYNELGQVVDKKLHDTGSSVFMQSVDYRYHIRGWLLSINNAKLGLDSKNDETDDYFGMELKYDSADSGLGSSAYYNGNISATKWKTTGESSGNAGRRAYAYTYDKSNRLTQANFKAYGTSAWDKEAGTLNERMTYDFNGNILNLSRKQNSRGLSGTTITSSVQTLDSLTYTYASGFGNRMTKIEDAGLTTGFNNTVTANDEYKYDTMGNLTVDRNKGIDSVKYNELGKVKRVKFTNGQSINYYYDAAGRKLTVKNYNTSGTLTTTTDYVGGFVYVNSALSFFSSPEGRVVKNGANLEYQYAIGDHQGNTRVVFTSATPTPVDITATFEGDGGDQSSEFTNVSNIVSFTAANHTAGGIKVIRMNQSYATGPAKSLKVYPGDKIDMQVYSYFESSSGYGTSNTAAASMVTVIAAAFGGVSGAGGESGNIFNGVNSAVGAFGLGTNPGDSRPSAFLNYILFDQNYKVMDMGWTIVPSSASFAKQLISIPQVTVKEAGYIFVYLSYEDQSNNYVYFDDFKVTHTKSNLIQGNEYYPFGMQTANSWTRESTLGNNFLANGATELNVTTGWYDLAFRNYDPVLGRMMQVDPMAVKYHSYSTYIFSLNDPVFWNDPTGADVTLQDILYDLQTKGRYRASDYEVKNLKGESQGCGSDGGGGTGTSSATDLPLDWMTNLTNDGNGIDEEHLIDEQQWDWLHDEEKGRPNKINIWGSDQSVLDGLSDHFLYQNQNGGTVHLRDIVQSFDNPKKKTGFLDWLWGIFTDSYSANLTRKGSGNLLGYDVSFMIQAVWGSADDTGDGWMFVPGNMNLTLENRDAPYSIIFTNGTDDLVVLTFATYKAYNAVVNEYFFKKPK